MGLAPLQIYPACEADIPHILGFIRALAEYEKLSHQVEATEEALKEHLFGPKPAAGALVARFDGRPVGYALFFQTFSTFLGKPGLWLEDLFVLPEFRGRGIGRELLSEVAYTADRQGCARLEWSVLDWNESAIRFYQRRGASVMPDWRICRVTDLDRFRVLCMK